MRSGWSKCSICPNNVTNTIWIIGFIILLLGGIFILVVFNIRKSKESEFSILTKIATNYFQTVTATLSFNVEYPESFKKLLSSTALLNS